MLFFCCELAQPADLHASFLLRSFVDWSTWLVGRQSGVGSSVNAAELVDRSGDVFDLLVGEFRVHRQRQHPQSVALRDREVALLQAEILVGRLHVNRNWVVNT